MREKNSNGDYSPSTIGNVNVQWGSEIRSFDIWKHLKSELFEGQISNGPGFKWSRNFTFLLLLLVQPYWKQCSGYHVCHVTKHLCYFPEINFFFLLLVQTYCTAYHVSFLLDGLAGFVEINFFGKISCLVPDIANSR